MPQDKAAIYQTRVQAGEFLLVVQVPEEKSGETYLLLQSSGGEELSINDLNLPSEPEGSLTPETISPDIRSDLSEEAQQTLQQTFVEAYNQSRQDNYDHSNALLRAWDKVKQFFERDDKGIFSKRKS
ncbi:ChaB family protein [Synechococcus sp. Nb3U1]|nr:ChaB family protein [Synechococcus sp. Nb3U1]